MQETPVLVEPGGAPTGTGKPLESPLATYVVPTGIPSETKLLIATVFELLIQTIVHCSRGKPASSTFFNPNGGSSRLGAGVTVMVEVCKAVGVLVGVSVGLLVAVFVGVVVGVFVAVLVGVSVGVSVAVFVGLLVGVSVGVLVAVLVGVSVGVADLVPCMLVYIARAAVRGGDY